MTTSLDAQPAKARTGVNAVENLQVVPSGAAVGAEIRGIDLSQPVPEETKAGLRQAWADHGVLLWRDQTLPDISFLEAAAIFEPDAAIAASGNCQKLSVSFDCGWQLARRRYAQRVV